MHFHYKIKIATLGKGSTGVQWPISRGRNYFPRGVICRNWDLCTLQEIASLGKGFTGVQWLISGVGIIFQGVSFAGIGTFVLYEKIASLGKGSRVAHAPHCSTYIETFAPPL